MALHRFLPVALLVLWAAAPVPGGPEAPRSAENYDVVVTGSEPEGIAAGVTAARLGRRTLLVTSDPQLGATLTLAKLGMLDMNSAEHGKILTRGFFLEFYRAIGKTAAFDVARAQDFFDHVTAAEPTLTVKTGVPPDALEAYVREGRRVIDATGDCSVAAAAGAPAFPGREDLHLPDRMADSLILHIRGVDWAALARFTKGGKITDAKIDPKGAWGFLSVARGYVPQSARARLRGLNIARQADGSVLINALLVFGISPFDAESVRDGIADAKREAPRVVEFLRGHLPGFEHAEWVNDVDRLYVRETRHVVAEYPLKLSDIIENRDFPDAIAVGSYPVDHQSYNPSDFGTVYGKPKAFAIPFRSLIPKGMDHMLVVGRCAGYTSLAAGSARVIPVGMVEGEAAGVAASISLDTALSFPEMARKPEVVAKLQKALLERGLLIHPPAPYPSPFAGNPHRKEILAALDLGLISGGYNNDFHLNARLSREQIEELWKEAARRRFGEPARKMPAGLPALRRGSIPKQDALVWIVHHLTIDGVE